MVIKIRKPKVILLDVEGTLTSIDFVGNILLPYIRSHLKVYLQENWLTHHLMPLVHKLKEIQIQDTLNGQEAPIVKIDDEYDQLTQIQSVVDNVIWQMDKNKLNTTLQKIYLLVWLFGYENNDLKGHLFKDVPTSLQRWFDTKLRIFVYAQGLVIANKILLKHSASDLTQLIEDYFDKSYGKKNDEKSYSKIAEKLNILPEEMLFITGNPSFANAAMKSKCQVVIVIRTGNIQLTADEQKRFLFVNSFNEISFVDLN